jgi:hypothetical protein
MQEQRLQSSERQGALNRQSRTELVQFRTAIMQERDSARAMGAIQSKIQEAEQSRARIQAALDQAAQGNDQERMNQANQALAMLDGEIAYLQKLAQERAGQQGGGSPQPGEVMDGYEFLGGNPADPNNWRPAQ